MGYWLSVGLSFDVAREALKTLKEKVPDLLNSSEGKRLMLCQESEERSLQLSEFDIKQVMAAWAEGRCVVPVWLDAIAYQLRERLRG